jgi:hypothetical protein
MGTALDGCGQPAQRTEPAFLKVQGVDVHREDVLHARPHVQLCTSSVVNVPAKRSVATLVVSEPHSIEPEVSSAIDAVKIQVY